MVLPETFVIVGSCIGAGVDFFVTLAKQGAAALQVRIAQSKNRKSDEFMDFRSLMFF